MATRERSPNYPAYDLPSAIGYSRALYDRDKRTTVPMESLAQAVGSEKLSGPSRGKIAAMKQFGLLDRVSAGKYKLSSLGLIFSLHHEADSEYTEALKAAVTNPPLFAQLFEQFGESSDQTLRIHLIRDREFSEEGAKRVIRTFRKSLEFAKISEAERGIKEDDSELRRVDDESELKIDTNVRRIAQASNASDDAIQRNLTALKRRYSSSAPNEIQEYLERQPTTNGPQKFATSFKWLLSNGVTAKVEFEGALTPEAVDMMIDYLKIMRKAVPNAPADLKYSSEISEE